MSVDDPRVRLRHMLEYASHARRLVAGRAESDLETDVALRLAPERAIEIIGEAANGLPDGFHARHPEIAWHKIVGMRNWLAHGYHAVRPDIVWNTAVEHLAPLEAQIASILHADFDEEP